MSFDLSTEQTHKTYSRNLPSYDKGWGVQFVFLNSDEVMLSGGRANGRKINNCFKVSMNKNAWSELSQMLSKRMHHGAIKFDEKVYVFGWLTTDTAEIYTIEDDRWNKLPSLPKTGGWYTCIR